MHVYVLVTLERNEMEEQQQDKGSQGVHTGERPTTLSLVTFYNDLTDRTTKGQGKRK